MPGTLPHVNPETSTRISVYSRGSETFIEIMPYLHEKEAMAERDGLDLFAEKWFVRRSYEVVHRHIGIVFKEHLALEREVNGTYLARFETPLPPSILTQDIKTFCVRHFTPAHPLAR